VERGALERWRDAAAKLPGKRQGKRYPASMKAAAVELAREAAASGMATLQVCRGLGIPEVTLKAWGRTRELVPVVVVENQLEGVRLMVGGGHADLTVAQLADLLRRLG
jgi:hypothetical protein